MLLQRQRDIENQVVLYHLEQNQSQAPDALRSVSKVPPNQSEAFDALASRLAPVDLTTLQVYEEYR